MPNRIRVRLFAIQRELAGAREIALELPPGATIEAAWAALVERHPVLAPGRPAVRFARNGEYTDPETALDDGDELAVIPPVSGGDETETETEPGAVGAADRGPAAGSTEGRQRMALRRGRARHDGQRSRQVGHLSYRPQNIEAGFLSRDGN